MKLLIKFFALFTLLIFLVSCENKASQSDASAADTSHMEKDISHLKVDISGMTCEIGCARLIQSKLYKAEGIEFARVTFEDSTGVLTYDANRISVEQIKKVIESAGGGDLYTVKAMHGLEELPALE